MGTFRQDRVRTEIKGRSAQGRFALETAFVAGCLRTTGFSELHVSVFHPCLQEMRKPKRPERVPPLVGSGFRVGFQMAKCRFSIQVSVEVLHEVLCGEGI